MAIEGRLLVCLSFAKLLGLLAWVGAAAAALQVGKFDLFNFSAFESVCNALDNLFFFRNLADRGPCHI
ncbi:hypothetical protein [Pseudomonas sp. NY15354]|uniref:hypothetical protein n=1 Tax=Pseudomonas sp. NY15354 TaxID=3400351 RepID=UPI003A89FD3A